MAGHIRLTFTAMKTKFLPLLIVLSASCSKGPPPTDAWAGTWNGPEGTTLDIKGSNGIYQITIRDLDAARPFEGSASGDGIAFQRDGVREVITATGGKETGMKWLADKRNCLTVKPGEGYCRD
jgi:hypothetical protein